MIFRRIRDCLLPGLVFFILFQKELFGDDVSSILNQIKNEKATPKATSNLNAPLSVNTKTTGDEKSKPDVTAPTAQKNVKQTSAKSGIRIWAPRDKFPKMVEGDGVAGRFAIEGHYEGRLCLVPIEDRMNPFARHFVVVNRTLNLPEYHVLPISDREMVEVSKSKPLIIESKGIMGYYYVRAQD
jgi:hypothetical protein